MILRNLNYRASTQILKQVFLPSAALDWLDQARLARAGATEVKVPERPKAKNRSAEKRKNEGGRSKNHAK